MAKNFFGKKIGYSFLLSKFEKEASKKEKIAKVLKPQKLKKTKSKKALVQTLPINDISQIDNLVSDFLSLQQRLPGMVFVKYQFSF